MPRSLRLAFVPVAVALVALTASVSGQSGYQPSTAKGDWTHYTADVRGTKYIPLDQINASNFNQLEVAWRLKTDNLGTRPEYKLEGTPIAIKGVLYATAGTRRSVIAVDGASGEILWTHRYPEGKRGAAAP
jgi:quinoprotein glucose dehydrogenase